MLTLEDARQLLALYQRMTDAAEAADWDALAALEQDAAALRQAAHAQQASAALSAADVAELQTAITEILALDRAIRIHAEPALESTRKLLASSVKGRAMRDAYGG